MKVPKCLVLMSFLISSAMSVSFSQAILPVGENFKISDEAGMRAIGGKPAIAGDGTDFFVVWRDKRNYSTSLLDVYAARVSHKGIVLDTAGIPISRSKGDLDSTACPSVAFDGTNYLVVWVGTVPGTSISEIFGVRVSRNGVVLDTPEIQLTTNGDARPRPLSLAFDGTNYLVVWRTNGSQIRGMRVSPTGVNLDSSVGFAIATIGGDFYPYVAFGDTTFMVTWFGWGDNGLDIFGARVARDGAVLDPEGFTVNEALEEQSQPSIAFDGTNFLVAWYDGQYADQYGNGSACGTRVSTSGKVLDNPAFKIADHAGNAAVVFDGIQYFVVWHENLWPAKYRNYDVYGRRVSREGTLLDDKPIPISTSYGNQFGPVVGCDSGYVLVAWVESNSAGRSNDGGVFGQMLQKVPTHPPGLVPLPVSNTNAKRSSRAVDQNISGWIPQSSPTSQPIHSIWGFSDTSIFAVTEGDDGMMIGYHGNQWSLLTPTPRARKFGLWGSSPSDLWTVGWCWNIVRYDGSNVDYTDCMGTQGGVDLIIGMGIWGFGNTNRITVGVQGGCLSYEGASFEHQQLIDRSNWREQFTGVNYDLWSIWGSTPNNFYAVGEFGTILRYEGNAWTKINNVPTIQSLNGVWGSGGSDIFAVGDFGTILHYGGASWIIQASNASEDLFAVCGFNRSDIYAVGRYGTIVHYDGSTWTTESSGTTQHLEGIWAGKNTVWAVGDQGTILRKGIATGVRNSDDVPTQYSLGQNYPNPFNPCTTIQFSLPKSTHVILKICNTLGQEVAMLVNEQRSPGYYQVQWNANVPSGVYFYRLQAGEFVQTKKMILLR